MRVLIADSDPSLADIYESFFSNEGYDVEVAGNGLECVERARQRRPDALVLEYELPWGGGDGVLARLREEYSLMASGVVLLTCDDTDDLADELAPPVFGCLRKPFQLRELSEMVRLITKQPPREAGRLFKDLTIPSRKMAQ